jgi:hypothetical protein
MDPSPSASQSRDDEHAQSDGHEAPGDSVGHCACVSSECLNPLSPDGRAFAPSRQWQ